MEPLSLNERKIVNRLKKIKSSGLFYDMIQSVVDSQDVEKIRQLIADIKMQACDAPDETARVVGDQTTIMIIKLSA